MVRPGEDFAPLADGHSLRPDEPSDYARLLGALREPPAGVVYLWGLDSPAPEASAEPACALSEGCGRVVRLLRALAQHGWERPPRLWLVTSGAQTVGEEPAALSQAPLWGVGKVIPYEYPELACSRVDLGWKRCDEEVRALGAELLVRVCVLFVSYHRRGAWPDGPQECDDHAAPS